MVDITEKPDGDIDWRPTASMKVLRFRAEIYTKIRAFFANREVLEVETPMLSRYGNTDPNIHSFSTNIGDGANSQHHPWYLHTSPEFPMKRLLSCGSGPIYQICKVFRDGEYGRFHNPEFTLLEWYRPGYDHHQLMQELAELVFSMVSPDLHGNTIEKVTYRSVFQSVTGLDPMSDSVEHLRGYIQQQGMSVQGIGGDDRDAWLDLIMANYVQPTLGRQKLSFVYDYPASQSALARLNPEDATVAERFELFMEGIELANGYHELTEPLELRQRFKSDQRLRKKNNLKLIPYDENLLAALGCGMSNTAGVAVGLDRLILLMTGEESLKKVLAFCIKRA